MGFSKRRDKSEILIKLLTNYFWNDAKKEFNIVQCFWGYENVISDNMMIDMLKRSRSSTANYIRFQPDFIVAGESCVFLMEYKVTSTPRYSERERQWDIGQVEADAWSNYLRLISIGVNIGILIYCPYHRHPLLCDIPKIDWEIRSGFVKSTVTGSGTPYVNIDLQKLRTFSKFMVDEFKIDLKFLAPRVRLILRTAREVLPTQHDPKSPYFADKGCQTGWNWLEEYF